MQCSQEPEDVADEIQNCRVPLAQVGTSNTSGVETDVSSCAPFALDFVTSVLQALIPSGNAFAAITPEGLECLFPLATFGMCAAQASCARPCCLLGRSGSLLQRPCLRTECTQSPNVPGSRQVISSKQMACRHRWYNPPLFQKVKNLQVSGTRNVVAIPGQWWSNL